VLGEKSHLVMSLSWKGS